jgi:hypothetical protein
VALLDIVYNPMRDSGGSVQFPRLQPGTELGFETLLGREPERYLPFEHYKHVVYANHDWDFRTFDVDRDLPKAVEKDRAVGHFNANDPDLMPGPVAWMTRRTLPACDRTRCCVMVFVAFAHLRLEGEIGYLGPIGPGSAIPDTAGSRTLGAAVLSVRCLPANLSRTHRHGKREQFHAEVLF